MIEPPSHSRQPVPGPEPRPRRLGRWLIVAGLVTIGIAALALWTSGGDGSPADPRAAALALEPEDVAPSRAETVRRVSPPVDIGAMERGLKAATLGQVPMPSSRQVSSYFRSDTSDEITQAVLVYDDVDEAATLDRLAAPLLGSAFDMTERPLDLPGTQDARHWTRPGYQVATFRIDGVVMVVATTSADPASLVELAALARDKAMAQGTGQAIRTP